MYLSEKAEGQTVSTSFGWHNLAVWPTQAAVRAPEVDELPMPERLEPGNPSMMVVMHLDQALEVLLSIGIERISDHARTLSEQVSTGLKELGFTVISPQNRSARSGNTCFLVKDAATMQTRLAEIGVLCWGEFGRMRISTHLYNGSADVAHLLKALSDQ